MKSSTGSFSSLPAGRQMFRLRQSSLPNGVLSVVPIVAS
jgi:hypothetical protein